MIGLTKFLKETWWLFAGAAVTTVVMAVTSGLWFYLLFLPVLCAIAVYMSIVRYDREGNVRGDLANPSTREPAGGRDEAADGRR